MRVVIDKLRSGRWRVRAEDADRKLKPVDVFDFQEEAIACRAAVQKIGREKGLPRDAATLAGFVEGGSKRRALNAHERRRREQHLLEDEIAALPLAALRRRDVKRWIERLRKKHAKQRGPGCVYVDSARTLSGKTIRECVSLLRCALADAVEDELVRSNAAAEMRLPRKGAQKALSFLYPDEDARLLRCPAVPLTSRIAYGFLAREGMRKSEALGLTWGDVDLERGIVRLDENKTNDPRAWALDASVAEVLAWWKAERTDIAAADRVFVGHFGEPLNTLRCKRFREQLVRAGVVRPELHEASAVRIPIRVHDLRATFVTLELAAGRNERWVQDRTGHTTNAMLQRYRRAARTVAEIGLGRLGPLASLLPELADPLGDPRGVIRANAQVFSCDPWSGKGDSKPLPRAPDRRNVPQVARAADHLADHARRLRDALLAEDEPAIEASVRAIADAAGTVIDEAGELRRRILTGDVHRVALAIRMIDLLVPDAADEAGRSGARGAG